MLTTEQIAAIRERCERATPGPWKCGIYGSVSTASGIVILNTRRGTRRGNNNDEDAIFVAHAREDIPILLDILDAANARAEALESALSTSCYACLSHNTQDDWICETCRDAGEYPHLRKTNWRFDAARFAGKDSANDVQ